MPRGGNQQGREGEGETQTGLHPCIWGAGDAAWRGWAQCAVHPGDALGEGLWVSRRSRRSLGGSLVSLSILIENAPTNGTQFGLRPWLRQSLRDCSYLWVVNHAAGWMAL